LINIFLNLKTFFMRINAPKLITARLALIVFLVTAFIACDKTMPKDELGPYNLDVKLYSSGTEKFDIKSSGFGFIKFRQDPNVPLTITLDTWVFNLTPNHDYLLQRAVNPITDNDCSSTAWLTLGKGLVSQPIQTDAFGNGMENLFRNVPASAEGTTFRIHFQIIDAVSLATVLTSDCDQYTVR
jgi:hypothetical protein